MPLVDPVILVPGITATNLQNKYPLPPETVWKLGAISTKKYERVALHPNDLRYEALEPARVKPDYITEIAYGEIVEELRYNLSDSEDTPVPVYPFGYDWRMPLDVIESQLDNFIEEIINRTRLLRHYHKEGYADHAKVNLVGHSMGGLVITGYLERKGDKAPVNKVVTLATPYQGSFEAVISVCTGTANLGMSSPSSREREASRMTPALYHLLPSFSNGITTEPGIPGSLYDSGAWQPSVVASISEFIRLKGLPTSQLGKDAADLFAKMLSDAEKHRDRINGFNLANSGLDTNDWLAVVGVDSETRVRLKIVQRSNGPDFDLSSGDRMNNWEPVDQPDQSARRFTGDGTVPLEGAIPPFLKDENLVCITPQDYGYWEVQDRALTKIAGFHGILPNMNMLHRLIVRFFTGKPDARGNTWGRRMPGVEQWQPPLELREKK